MRDSEDGPTLSHPTNLVSCHFVLPTKDSVKFKNKGTNEIFWLVENINENIGESLKSSGVPCRAVELVQTIDSYVDHVDAVLLFSTPLALPDVSPRDDDDQLSYQEEGTGDDQAHGVDARTGQQILLDEYFGDGRVAVVGHGRQVHVLGLLNVQRRFGFGSELVDDFNGLDDEHFFLSSFALPAGQSIALPASVRTGGARFAAEVGDVALDRLTGRQTRRDQTTELDFVRSGKFECVKGRDEDLVALHRLVDDAHDGSVGRATAFIDQQNFVVVDTVEGDQISDEDLVRAVLVDNLETQVERIADLSGDHVRSVGWSDAHDDVGRVDDGLFAEYGRDVASDSQIDHVSDALIAQIVLTVDRQTQIGAGHDAVVMLQDDVVGVAAVAVSANVTFDVVVGHTQLEFQTGRHIVDARVGASLGVDFAVEDFAGADLGHHVARTAVDGHVVARAQFVGSGSGNLQIRFL